MRELISVPVESTPPQSIDSSVPTPTTDMINKSVRIGVTEELSRRNFFNDVDATVLIRDEIANAARISTEVDRRLMEGVIEQKVNQAFKQGMFPGPKDIDLIAGAVVRRLALVTVVQG